MSTYGQWNLAIFDALFPRDNQTQPTYLYVDEELLAEIAEASQLTINGDFLADFKNAVNSFVVEANKVNLNVLLTASTDPVPIQVAFLALTVLAASRMESENDSDFTIRSSNYYVRLNDLLGIHVSGKPEGLNSFQFEKLWHDLRKALLQQSRGNLQLTAGASTRKFVWYPISQSLLSKGDRSKLKEFFLENSYPAFTAITKTIQNFERDLSEWVERSTLSSRGKRLFHSPSRSSELFKQVRSDLSAWDGSVDEPIGFLQSVRNASTDLKFDLLESGGASFSLIFGRRPKFPGKLSLEANNYSITSLSTTDLESSYYDPVLLKELFDFDTNVTLTAQVEKVRHSFHWKRRSIIPFQRDPELFGSFISKIRPNVGLDTIVMFHRSNEKFLLDRVVELSGQSEVEIQKTARKINENWGMIGPFKILSPSISEDPRLSALNPTVETQVQLAGGVVLKFSGKRRVYLEGYQPEIQLLNYDSKITKVTFNGRSVSVKNDRVKAGKLTPGDYVVSATDCRSLRFSISHAEHGEVPIKKRELFRTVRGLIFERPIEGVTTHSIFLSGGIIEGLPIKADDTKSPTRDVSWSYHKLLKQAQANMSLGIKGARNDS